MNIKFEIQNPRILQVSKDLIDGRFFIRDCQKHNGYIKEFSNDLSGVFFFYLMSA